MTSPDSARARVRTWRGALIALYMATAVVVVMQRGIVGPQHNVFKIFRLSYRHLVAGRNLYGPYPTEQGKASDDLFKYSPTAALSFAPFAVLPYTVALLAWSLLGALVLYYALTRVLEPQPALLASVLVYPDLFAALQACSSNAQVAALIILAYAAIECRHQWRGAMSIVLGAAIKIFPLAALSFAVFHPQRRRCVLIVAVVALVAILLPLVATSPALLVQQYRWWYAIERSDAADVAFGLSAMRLVRGWMGASWPSWPVQLAGTVVLLAPLALCRERWRDREFRLAYLASLLAFVVLFNHQAERSSFVIASAGVAIWCVNPPQGTKAFWPRAILAVSALVGLKTIPLLAVWLVMQAELFGWRARLPRRGDAAARQRNEAQALGTSRVAGLARRGSHNREGWYGSDG